VCARDRDAKASAKEKRVTMCFLFIHFFRPQGPLFVVHNQELKAEERPRAIRGGAGRDSFSLFKSLSIIIIITFLNFSNTIKTVTL
jgi:hypothetical protein